jgi:hypothetical protein
MAFWRTRGSAIKIGIFVEGPSDKKVMRILIGKIFGWQSRPLIRINSRGVLLNNNNLESLKKSINLFLQQNRDIKKILICVDKDCDEGFWGRLKSLEENIIQNIPAPPIYCIPVINEIESWLLDEEALSETLGQRVRVYGDPEAHGAFKKLERIFDRAGKDYRKVQHGPQIARYIQPNKLRSQSSSFEAFYQKVKDP